MNPDYWKARWQEGRIGFHEGKPNGFLLQHADRLAGAKRVLVPLCGKTEDMAFLADAGHQVVGVDVSREAVAAFFEEHRLTPAVSTDGAFEIFRSGAFTLLVGDVFLLTREATGDVDAFYDRAALIALPERERRRYATLLRQLVPEGRGLIVTLDYPQEKMQGPPFSVTRQEIHELYAGMAIELLGDHEAQGPTLRAAGIAARELCFAVTSTTRAA
jgi:thiopurine S-methyltransferase